MRSAAEIATQMAAHVNSHAVSKAYGATLSPGDLMDAATAISDLERRIDAVGRQIADRAIRLETMVGPDFSTPARRSGAAGAADAPLTPAEAERVNRVINKMEEEDF